MNLRMVCFNLTKRISRQNAVQSVTDRERELFGVDTGWGYSRFLLIPDSWNRGDLSSVASIK